MPERVMDGRSELMERLAQAAAQVVTSGLNALSPSQSRAVLAALDNGARVRLMMDLDPLEITCALVARDGSAVVEVFRGGF